MLNVHKTELDGVLIIEPNVFNDQRGYFFETFNQNRYQEIGIQSNFVQDNLSFSKNGTLMDSPIVSEKDAQFSCLKDIVEDRLPLFK